MTRQGHGRALNSMNNGRDDKGRFVSGNPGGPGRPRRQVEQEYHDVMINAVSPEDWHSIIQTAVVQALDGSHEARRFLADYILGKPLQRTELTGAEGGPVQHMDLSGLTD